MNLDTSHWKTFLLSSLYNIRMGDKLDKNKMSEDNPHINFVSRISYNNGVDLKVDRIDDITPNDAGLMTVSLGGEYLGSCYIQTENFYTAQNIAILEPKNALMNKYVNQFICTLVKFECRTKYYAFGRELNTHINRDFEINLPIERNANGQPIIDNDCIYSPDGYIPNWKFMENYIKSLHHKPLATENLLGYTFKIELPKWKEFKLPRIFHIEAGTYYSSEQYEEGETPYISASATNNGIGKLISVKPDFQGNKITIGKLGAIANYQPFPFCATSDVNVLTPKFNMNCFNGLFIVSVINFSENYKWDYGRQCRVGDTKEITIKLPVLLDKSGIPIKDSTCKYSSYGYIPDWDFMEQYIKLLPYGDRL